MLHDRLAKPVNARVVANCVVSRIYENHLIVLVYGILSDPVAVQNAKATADLAPHLLLGNGPQVTRRLLLPDTYTRQRMDPGNDGGLRAHSNCKRCDSGGPMDNLSRINQSTHDT